MTILLQRLCHSCGPAGEFVCLPMSLLTNSPAVVSYLTARAFRSGREHRRMACGACLRLEGCIESLPLRFWGEVTHNVVAELGDPTYLQLASDQGASFLCLASGSASKSETETVHSRRSLASSSRFFCVTALPAVTSAIILNMGFSESLLRISSTDI